MKIIAVFKTHFDIGFTDLSKNVIEKYCTSMADDVISTCESTQNLGKSLEYVWTMSSWPLYEILRRMNKLRLEKFEKLIKRGQVVCHALPFTVHSEFLTQREIFESIKYARIISQKYNIPMPISAKMTDVPGHSMGIIEPLVKNGVEFLHLGCNPASLAPKVPLLFWWQDKSGNRILTMYNTTYGASILPPKDWKYPVWLALQMTNDNQGPQAGNIIAQMKDEILDTDELIVSTMDEFVKEIKKYDLTQLPVIKGDLGDTWIHGIGSYPVEVSMIRRARADFVQLEKEAISRGIDISEESFEFFDNILLFGEHTWGMDVKTHLTWERSYKKEKFVKERELPRYKKIEASWDEQRQRAIKCKQLVSDIETKLNIKSLPLKCLEKCSNNWKIKKSSDGVVLISPKGVKIAPRYEYEIVDYMKISAFIKQYLTRFYEWAIADFGRQSYPEIQNEIFVNRIVGEKFDSKDDACLEYIPEKEISFKEYGNANKIIFDCVKVKSGVLFTVKLNQKQATPIVEGGNMIFATSIKRPSYFVDKMGIELDCKKDIVENANQVMYSVGSYARINSIKIYPIDSPLVSFGESGIYKFNGGKFIKPKAPDFVFNLFNNMWGTNFPQWSEGDFIFKFLITEE